MGRNMKNKLWGIIPIFTFIFLYKMVLYNEIPIANDLVAHKPITKWTETVNESSNDFPHWFPNLFSGMPSYGGEVYSPRGPTTTHLNLFFFYCCVKILFFLTLGGVGLFFFFIQLNFSILFFF